MEQVINRDYSHLRVDDYFKYQNRKWLVVWNRTDNYKLGAIPADDFPSPATIFWYKGTNNETR